MNRALALALLLAAGPTQSEKMEFDKYQLIILRTVSGAPAMAKEDHDRLVPGEPRLRASDGPEWRGSGQGGQAEEEEEEGGDGPAQSGASHSEIS